MKVFTTNYHIAVNRPIVEDLVSAGLEVVMPAIEFQQEGLLHFFSDNSEHSDIATIISYDEFMNMEPMALILNCSQLYDDMMKLYVKRGKKDILILLSSQVGFGEWIYDRDTPDINYLISHSLDYHRISNAQYKIMYFNKPYLTSDTKTSDEIRKSFDNKKISLYINHFDPIDPDVSGEHWDFRDALTEALSFRHQWLLATGNNIPFYGAENKDGYLYFGAAQADMKESMFTLVLKKHETWGQMVNESMLLGTPCIFLNKYIVDMFKEYLINNDTAIVDDSVENLINKINSMSFEEYETLVVESRNQSNMFCNSSINAGKLKWLFEKVEQDLASR